VVETPARRHPKSAAFDGQVFQIIDNFLIHDKNVALASLLRFWEGSITSKTQRALAFLAGLALAFLAFAFALVCAFGASVVAWVEGTSAWGGAACARANSLTEAKVSATNNANVFFMFFPFSLKLMFTLVQGSFFVNARILSRLTQTTTKLRSH